MSRNVKVLKNASYLFINYFVVNIVSIFAMAYVARKLGVNHYGIFALAFTLPSFLCSLSTLGLRGVMVREVASREDQDRNEYLSKVIPLRFMLTSAAALTLFIISPYLYENPDMVKAMRIALIGAFSDEITWTVNDVFQGIEEMGKLVVREIGVRLFTAVLACVFLWLGYGLFTVCWAYVAGSMIGVTYMVTLFRKRFTVGRFNFDWEFSKKALKEGAGFALTAFGGLILVRTDIIMISKMSGLVSLGIYNAAYVLSSKIDMIADALGTSMFPAMSNAYKKKEKFESLVCNGLEIMLFISFPITLGAMFVAEDIIEIIFGDSYAQSAIIFAIFALALPFKFFGSVFTYTLSAVKKQYLVSKIILTSALVNIVLNYLFILKAGIQGAATATLVVCVLSFAMLSFHVKKTLSISFGLKRLLSVVPPLLLLLVFLYFSESLHFIVRIIVGAVIYLVSATFTSSVMRNTFLKFYNKSLSFSRR